VKEQYVPRYKKENIITSEKAYEIFRNVIKNRESYSSEIARELRLNQGMTSELISLMVELNILEKIEDKRKPTYYKAKFEGFETLFVQSWVEKFIQDESKKVKSLEDLYNALNNEDITDKQPIMKAPKDSIDFQDVENFIKTYVRNNLMPGITFKELLTTHFIRLTRELDKDFNSIPKSIYMFYNTLRAFYKDDKKDSWIEYSILKAHLESCINITDFKLVLGTREKQEEAGPKTINERVFERTFLDREIIEYRDLEDHFYMVCSKCSDLFRLEESDNYKEIVCSCRREQIDWNEAYKFIFTD